MTENSTKRIQLLVPAQTLAGIDELIENGHFVNQQEAVRFLLKTGLESFNLQSVEVTE